MTREGWKSTPLGDKAEMMRSVSSFDFVLTGKRGGVRCPHGKLGVQPVRSAGARHSGARGQCGTSVSQIAIFIIADMQICTKWKLQLRR